MNEHVEWAKRVLTKLDIATTTTEVSITEDVAPLVERLRAMSRRGRWPLLGDEAADEIERLRAALDAVRAEERERWTEAVMAELDGNGQAQAIVAYAIRATPSGGPIAEA